GAISIASEVVVSGDKISYVRSKIVPLDMPVVETEKSIKAAMEFDSKFFEQLGPLMRRVFSQGKIIGSFDGERDEFRYTMFDFTEQSQTAAQLLRGEANPDPLALLHNDPATFRSLDYIQQPIPRPGEALESQTLVMATVTGSGISLGNFGE